jgi:hypothetical protein
MDCKYEPYVLISTHIAQDFAAYADPLTSALMYRPHLLKGDLHTLASIPFIPTSRRSWTHTQAQTHFVCCTTHVVSDEGRGVSGDGVAEGFSDCSEYFEVTRKKKKKWNRAAAALKMSCKSSSQVDSHAPPHQPSTPEPHKGVFNVSSLSTREGIDGSSNAQEEMVLRQV